MRFVKSKLFNRLFFLEDFLTGAGSGLGSGSGGGLEDSVSLCFGDSGLDGGGEEILSGGFC